MTFHEFSVQGSTCDQWARVSLQFGTTDWSGEEDRRENFAKNPSLRHIPYLIETRGTRRSEVPRMDSRIDCFHSFESFETF